jgi:hypothetical protein
MSDLFEADLKGFSSDWRSRGQARSTLKQYVACLRRYHERYPAETFIPSRCSGLGGGALRARSGCPRSADGRVGGERSGVVRR